MSGVRKTVAIENSFGGPQKHTFLSRAGAISNLRWFPTRSHQRFFDQRARAFCRLTHFLLISCAGLPLFCNRQDNRP
jgi:hypothetical protein